MIQRNISELEDRIVEMTEADPKKEWIKRNEDYLLSFTLYGKGPRRRHKVGAENIFEDIKDGNVSKMEEEANIQIKGKPCPKKDQPKE